MHRLTAFTLLTLCACSEPEKSGETQGTNSETTSNDTTDSSTDGTTGEGTTDGTTDDDTGEENTTDDSEYGANDTYAAAGCALRGSAPTPLVLGASEAEANTAIVLPAEGASWMLQMPPTGDGWMTVEVPDWMTVVRFFADEGVEIEIFGGEAFSPVLKNAACPDAGISDQRWAFHDWGAYTIRVAEGAPAEVWFTVVKEE